MKHRILLLMILAALLAAACKDKSEPEPYTKVSENERDAFSEYWFAGKAEISSFDLKQFRYGEYRDGTAVLIFVTEDIDPVTHIKLDDPEKDGADKVKVMKMNKMRNYQTGIYPYSQMLSVFHPFDDPNYSSTLKLSMSSQEWCGHVFNQLNYHGNGYQAGTYSYFENAGDRRFTLDAAIPEDGIWVQLKVNPHDMPIGERAYIPGLFHGRASHQALGPLQASTSWTASDSSKTYHLDYTNIKLSIELRNVFPYEILGWEEWRYDGGDPTLISRGTLRKRIVTDYWNLNSNEDIVWRDSLGL